MNMENTISSASILQNIIPSLLLIAGKSGTFFFLFFFGFGERIQEFKLLPEENEIERWQGPPHINKVKQGCVLQVSLFVFMPKQAKYNYTTE